MLLEILNASKDHLIGLYTMMPLAGLTQTMPDMVRPYTEQIKVLLNKILGMPGGMEENGLVYVGQWILTLVNQGIIAG